MKNETEQNPAHELISHTARGVAYARALSDIPFSHEIAQICNADRMSEDGISVHRRLSPFFEGRYKALSKLVKQSGIPNILEVACGLSSRGLSMCLADPSITYIEADLPEMIKLKREVVAELCRRKSIQMPSNLRFVELNILDRNALESIVALFPAGPIAICHEGLLAYFPHEEKWTEAMNIASVLLQKEGIWVTPDIFTLDDLDRMNAYSTHPRAMDEIKKSTKRDYRDNAFTDLPEAKRLYNALKIPYQVSTLREVLADEELATRNIGLDPKSVEDQLSCVIWKFEFRK